MSISRIQVGQTEHDLVASKLESAYTIDGFMFDGSNRLSRLGSCDTASNVKAKVVTFSGAPTGLMLAPGLRITVKFTYANSANQPTLSINGGSAYNIYWNNQLLPQSQWWDSGATLDFVLDNNARWNLIGVAKDNNTTYYSATTTSNGLMSSTDKSIVDGLTPVTTAGTGAAYTATVPGITSLTAGASFIMIPHTVSTSTTPTLNVNSLGAKQIRRRLSSIVTSAQAGYAASWLAEGYPFRVTYDGTYWIAEGHDKPAAADLYGTPAAATKATNDSSNQKIVDTYIKSLSVSGNVITYTKGNGTTNTITVTPTPTLNADGVLVF